MERSFKVGDRVSPSKEWRETFPRSRNVLGTVTEVVSSELIHVKRDGIKTRQTSPWHIDYWNQVYTAADPMEHIFKVGDRVSPSEAWIRAFPRKRKVAGTVTCVSSTGNYISVKRDGMRRTEGSWSAHFWELIPVPVDHRLGQEFDIFTERKL